MASGARNKFGSPMFELIITSAETDRNEFPVIHDIFRRKKMYMLFVV